MKKMLFSLLLMAILSKYLQYRENIYDPKGDNKEQPDKTVPDSRDYSPNPLLYVLPLSIAYMLYTIVRAKPVHRDEDGF